MRDNRIDKELEWLRRCRSSNRIRSLCLPERLICCRTAKLWEKRCPSWSRRMSSRWGNRSMRSRTIINYPFPRRNSRGIGLLTGFLAQDFMIWQRRRAKSEKKTSTKRKNRRKWCILLIALSNRKLIIRLEEEEEGSIPQCTRILYPQKKQVMLCLTLSTLIIALVSTSQHLEGVVFRSLLRIRWGTSKRLRSRKNV
jgi:hypothetical protein